MNRPAVSLIIPTFRPRLGVLDAVLDAALPQLCPGDDAIVVENGSGVLVGRFRPGVTFAQEPRPGSAFARLRGAELGRGEILWFLDDDTVPAPAHLAAGLSRFAEQPRLGIVGGGVSVMGEDQLIPSSAVARELFGERALGTEFLISRSGSVALPYFMPYAAGALLRRAVAEAHFGRLDSTFPGRVGVGGVEGCEDIEMVAAALREGWQVAYEPSMHVRHVIDARRFSFRYLARLSFGSARSYGRFLVKHGMEQPISRGGVLLRACKGLVTTAPLGRERILRYLRCLGRAAGRVRPTP